MSKLEIVAVDIDKVPAQEFKRSKFKEKPSEQEVENTIDELEAILVQRTKEAREFTMKVFWEAGELIRSKEAEFKVNISALVARIVADNRITGRQMGERNTWFAIKVYDSFPKFEQLYDTEFGENVSITKIKKMLVTPRPKATKPLQQIAFDLVDKLGVEQAEQLIVELQAEIKARTSKR